MNVHYAKFQKKFDSRTISRELPQVDYLLVIVVEYNSGTDRASNFKIGRAPSARPI